MRSPVGQGFTPPPIPPRGAGGRGAIHQTQGHNASHWALTPGSLKLDEPLHQPVDLQERLDLALQLL
eukprot:8630951-Pyramimonas_sp.AAC.1